MALRRRCLVLLPDLDRLVGLADDEPQSGAVEGRAHDAGLGVEAAGLGGRVEALEAVAGLPVPEADAAVVAAGEEHIVLVDGERVDNGVVTVEVLHKGPLGTLPLLDAPRRAARERKFFRVQGKRSHALFVVRQHTHRLAGREVPEADGAVEARGDDLRVRFLAFDVADGAFVPAQHVDVGARAHVPDSGDAVAAAGDEDVERWVERKGVHA